MRQEVNLYREEFREQHEVLSLKQGGQYLLVLVVVLALISVYGGWKNRQLEREVAAAEQSRAELLARVQELSEAVGSRGVNGELSTQLDRHREELDARRAVLAFLEDSEAGNETGFSEFLIGIASAHDPGMRITAVEISAGGGDIRLAGEVVDAEAVPLFFQRLAGEGIFRGKSFQTVRISSEDNDGLLAFSAATGAEPE